MIKLVSLAGLEPARPKPSNFKSDAATNYATGTRELVMPPMSEAVKSKLEELGNQLSKEIDRTALVRMSGSHDQPVCTYKLLNTKGFPCT